jgi:GDPmannose 4,6-dehydratase
MIPNEVLVVLQEELRDTRFFYAASAHIFGRPDGFPQNERTPFRPDTPYAISKTAGVHLCRYYRETHRLHTVSGILYNHESPRRSESFVTARIARAAAMASRGKGAPLFLRDLQATADWGAAEDYVDAMWRTLQLPAGDEFVISTGIPRTVMDFAREAFAAVGLRADDYVFQSPGTSGSGSIPYVGDHTKIRRACGWQPVKTFASLVKEMVEARINFAEP